MSRWSSSGALGAVVLAVVVAGCTSVSPPVSPPLRVTASDPTVVPVYIVYNSFHAGLTVPTAALAARPGPTATALRRLAPTPWTSLGYGDSKFYQQAGINPARIADLFRSMLAPGNPSVVQLAGVQDPLTDESHPKIIRLAIPAARFEDVVRRVDDSFALQDGAPEFVAPGRSGHDIFFRGRRPASVLHECNQWIGDVVGAAGVKHTPVLDTTSDGLAYDLVGRGYAVSVATAKDQVPEAAP